VDSATRVVVFEKSRVSRPELDRVCTQAVGVVASEKGEGQERGSKV